MSPFVLLVLSPTYGQKRVSTSLFVKAKVRNGEHSQDAIAKIVVACKLLSLVSRYQSHTKEVGKAAYDLLSDLRDVGFHLVPPSVCGIGDDNDDDDAAAAAAAKSGLTDLDGAPMLLLCLAFTQLTGGRNRRNWMPLDHFLPSPFAGQKGARYSIVPSSRKGEEDL